MSELDLDELERRLNPPGIDPAYNPPIGIPVWTMAEGRALLAEVRRLRALEPHFEPQPEASWRSADGRYGYDEAVMKWPPESHLNAEEGE